LSGDDLGAVINNFSHERLNHIAKRVAQAQVVTSSTASAGRYGYATLPDQAPHSAWSQVLDANLDRSQPRIESAGLFDPTLAIRSISLRRAATVLRTTSGRREPMRCGWPLACHLGGNLGCKRHSRHGKRSIFHVQQA